MNRWQIIFIVTVLLFLFYYQPQPTVENSIARAVNYLLSKRTVNGSWEDMDIPFTPVNVTSAPIKSKFIIGKSDEWVSCYVGYNLKIAFDNLKNCGYTPNNNFDWNKTLEFVLNTQRSTGGWGYNKKITSDVDSTAFCALFLSEFKNFDKEQQRAADFILKHQKENGGFPTYLSQQNVYLVEPESLNYTPGNYSWCLPHASVTASATLFLKKFNSQKYNNELKRASSYLLKLKNESGFWDDFWWNDRLYTTNLIFEALNYTNNYTVNWLKNIQNEDGGWYSGIKNGPSIAFYTALASEISTDKIKQDAILWLLNNQNYDGSWAGYKLYRGAASNIAEPWKNVNFSGTLISDNGIFTTVTVLRSLSNYYCSQNK